MNIDYFKVTFIVNLESKFKNLTFLVKCRPFSDQFCQKSEFLTKTEKADHSGGSGYVPVNQFHQSFKANKYS